MEQPALLLDPPGDCRQAGVGCAPAGRSCLRGGDLGLQHLEIVEPAQRVLRPAQSAHQTRGTGDTRVGCQLQTVAKLLGRNPYLMEMLGGVELPRLIDRSRQPFGSLQQSGRECLAPGLPAVSRDRLRDPGQPASELVGIDLVQAREHDPAQFLPLPLDMEPNILQGGPREVLGTGQLVEQQERDVKLSDRPERTRQPPDFSPCLRYFRRFQPGREHWNGLA